MGEGAEGRLRSEIGSRDEEWRGRKEEWDMEKRGWLYRRRAEEY